MSRIKASIMRNRFFLCLIAIASAGTLLGAENFYRWHQGSPEKFAAVRDSSDQIIPKFVAVDSNDLEIAGLDRFQSIDLDETEEQVFTGAKKLHQLIIWNRHDEDERFVKIYDALIATVTVGTTVPAFEIPVPPGKAGIVITLPKAGTAFATGMSAAATTAIGPTDTGAPGANEVVIFALYK